MRFVSFSGFLFSQAIYRYNIYILSLYCPKGVPWSTCFGKNFMAAAHVVVLIKPKLLYSFHKILND